MLKRGFNTIKSEIRRLVDGGVFHILAGSFITKFVALFGSPIFTRMFTKADYGVIGYVENLFSYAYLFAGLGLKNAILRYVVKADTVESKYAYYNFVVKRSTLYNIIIMIVGAIFFAFFYPHDADFSGARLLLPILFLSLPFHSLYESNLMCYRSMFNNKLYAYYSCAVSIGLLAVKCLIAAIFKLNGVFFTHTIVYALAVIIMSINIKRSYFGNISSRTAPSLTSSQKKETTRYSLQYMVTNGIWAMFMLNDIFLLGKITADSTVVANYKVAYVLPGCLSLLSTAISVFVTPYFVKHEDDHGWVRRNLVKTILTMLCVVGLAGSVICLFSKPLLMLLYGKKYVEVAPLMCVLTLAASINLIFRGTIANVLAATGKVMANMMISLGGIIVQILSIIFITGKYAAYGVAWTTVGVYALMSVALAIAFVRYYGKKNASVIDKNV